MSLATFKRSSAARGLISPVHGDVEHVGGNVEVVTGTHDVPELKLIPGPHLKLVAAQHIEGRFVPLVHMRLCALAR